MPKPPRRAFGNIAAIQEQWYEHGRPIFLENLVRDLNLGARQIRRRPAFSLFVILTLAMGILEAVLLRPLPYRDPGRLVMLFSGDPARVARRPRLSAQFQGLEGAQSQF
jgi:macrolide transport system ATP-binding/permease protein